MNQDVLQLTIRAFNLRRYDQAVQHSAAGLDTARGRDEAFWLGLHEACEGYGFVSRGQLDRAESKLIGAMQKLRNFGFRYENFEVTVALAAVRRAVEEIRTVRAGHKRLFDVSIVPQWRLAAKADD
jgi:hypothetical protein